MTGEGSGLGHGMKETTRMDLAHLSEPDTEGKSQVLDAAHGHVVHVHGAGSGVQPRRLGRLRRLPGHSPGASPEHVGAHPGHDVPGGHARRLRRGLHQGPRVVLTQRAAEVGDFAAVLVVDEDVPRRKVSMDNAARVDLVEACEDVLKEK